ncbi:MAG TPA: DUF1684 domain-containing protein [Steroidobacteraceae bacterium]|nr:DUF1684 domain-containing protein [Steroidobacteraceae bacterium]
MRHLRLLGLFFSLSCFAGQTTPYQEWVEFKKELSEGAAGPAGMYAIQDMLEIDPGESAYLLPGKTPGEARWSKNANPAALATVEFRDKRATLRGPGIAATDLLQAKEPQALPIGLNVRASLFREKQLKVWLYNPKLPAQRKFKGLSFFPYDAQGVVEAKFVRNDTPVPVSYVDSRKATGTMYVVGTLRMQIAGKPYELKAYSNQKNWEKIDALLLLLRDRTSGRTTYEGGRVVDVHISPGAQTVTVNLNTAYSFLCAHSEYFNCPLVLVNRVDADLNYGEKYPPL